MTAGSCTVVVPEACSPASSTADLTCALAIGLSYSMPVSARPPSIDSGGRPSAAVAMRAPIEPSGSTTRAIGRPDSDASPVSVAGTPTPASSPTISRIAVPELPR